LKVPRRSISTEAVAKLKSYDFPGNIRELRNLVERAAILSETEQIGPEDFLLPGTASHHESREAWIRSLPDVIDLRSLLEDLERDLIRRALESSDGVQAEAARRLQLSRSDIGYKVSKHRIELLRNNG